MADTPLQLECGRQEQPFSEASDWNIDMRIRQVRSEERYKRRIAERALLLCPRWASIVDRV